MQNLMKTIRSTANANATLSAAVKSDVWWGEAPRDTKLPYIVYYNVGKSPVRCFAAAEDMTEVWVQFSIFDDRSAQLTEKIASDLSLVFDRKTLTYLSDTHVSCENIGGMGPDKLDDCWQRTADYRFRYR